MDAIDSTGQTGGQTGAEASSGGLRPGGEVGGLQARNIGKRFKRRPVLRA